MSSNAVFAISHLTGPIHYKWRVFFASNSAMQDDNPSSAPNPLHPAPPSGMVGRPPRHGAGAGNNTTEGNP